MEWKLKWGKDEDFLRDLEADGREVRALEERPELSDVQHCAFHLFWQLSPGRPLGFGAVGGITTVDIIAGAEAYGLPPDYALRMIRGMDAVYLDHLMEKRQTREKAQPAKPRRRR